MKRPSLRQRAASVRDERGSATVFVLGFAIVLLVAAGLSIDGGKAINARERLVDVSAQAARAGASAIDVQVLRSSGRVVLDPVAATAAACGYLSAAGYPCLSPTVTGNTVSVGTAWDMPTALLGLAGISTIRVSGSATAEAVTGINGATP